MKLLFYKWLGTLVLLMFSQIAWAQTEVVHATITSESPWYNWTMGCQYTFRNIAEVEGAPGSSVQTQNNFVYLFKNCEAVIRNAYGDQYQDTVLVIPVRFDFS